VWKTAATLTVTQASLPSTVPNKKFCEIEEKRLAFLSVFTLIRTDTTLDHSQKAEKV